MENQGKRLISKFNTTLNASTHERQNLLGKTEQALEYGAITSKNFANKQFTKPSFASEQDSPATNNSLYVSPFENATRADKPQNNNSTETTKFDETKPGQF